MSALKQRLKQEKLNIFNQRGFEPMVKRKTDFPEGNSELENFLQKQIHSNINDIKTVQTVKVTPQRRFGPEVLPIEQAWYKFDPDFYSWSNSRSNLKAQTQPGVATVLS